MLQIAQNSWLLLLKLIGMESSTSMRQILNTLLSLVVSLSIVPWTIHNLNFRQDSVVQGCPRHQCESLRATKHDATFNGFTNPTHLNCARALSHYLVVVTTTTPVNWLQGVFSQRHVGSQSGILSVGLPAWCFSPQRWFPLRLPKESELGLVPVAYPVGGLKSGNTDGLIHRLLSLYDP